jgi:GT2 family glycosyltransferase
VDKVLCSVATRGRYHTTLPLVLNAIINQTKKVDKLVIFDDNDEPQDMRNEMIYGYFFQMLNIKGIEWEWIYAGKKGQHHIHQAANQMGYDWVWRVDDDAIPEPNVLARLFDTAVSRNNVGAVGGSILTLPYLPDTSKSTGKIKNINVEPNIQWSYIQQAKEVEHLHCSFLYRAGVHDYNLGLSRVAHREETLFTYGLYKKGYKILVIPNAITWHLKNPNGGIRSETNQKLYEQDEYIFRNLLNYKDKTIVVLDCGMGDHIVFSHVLPNITNPEIFTCYPDIVPGRPIAEAYALFGNLEQYNIYRKMAELNWKGSLENAFRKMYV